MSLQSLDLTEFHRRFVDGLPGDSEPANFRRQVRGAAYSRVLPTPVSAPKLLAWSEDLAATLGLPLIPDDSAADVFSGNRLLPGMDPFAMCYGGHQFGNWAGQLGDGRAINLAEHHPQQHFHPRCRTRIASYPLRTSADPLPRTCPFASSSGTAVRAWRSESS